MAARLMIAEGTPPSGWDDQLRAAGGTIFHSSAWAAYVRATRHCSPLFLQLVDDAERPVALALAFHARSSSRLLSQLSGTVWLDSWPVAVTADHAAAVRTMLEQIEALARKLGAVEFAVGSFASPDAPLTLESLGHTTRRRFEFELDLERSDNDLLRSMEPARRRKIDKARRLGVAVVDLEPEAGLLEMRRLEKIMSERVVRRGGPRTGYDGNPGLDPARLLLSHGTGRLAGAAVDGQLVCVNLFTRFGPLVCNTHGGHDQRALETQAPTLLLWETARRYREEGAERFSLGGCSAAAAREDSPEHGVYVYKRGFGPTRLACTSGTRTLRPLAGRAVAVLRRFAPHTD